MLSSTALRKSAAGTQVYLTAAPHVRFKREQDGTWREVPRMGIRETRIKNSSQLFLLGVDFTK
jgi:hypothetical protein